MTISYSPMCNTMDTVEDSESNIPCEIRVSLPKQIIIDQTGITIKRIIRIKLCSLALK